MVSSAPSQFLPRQPDNTSLPRGRRKVKQSAAQQGDYITFSTFANIVKREKLKRYKLLMIMLFWLGLRISEALNIRPMDIDPMTKAELREVGFGQDVEHTIRIWRKRDKFQVLPLDPELRAYIMNYIRDFKIHEDQPLFDMKRNAVGKKLKKYGFTIGGRKRIHPHAIRRGFGIYSLAMGIPLNEIQQTYGHDKPSTTFIYLGADQRQALTSFARRQRTIISTEGLIGKAGAVDTKKGQKDSESLQ